MNSSPRRRSMERRCWPRPSRACSATVNREPWELDPSMFDGPLPSWVNTASPRVGAGLGTIARVVATGEAVYRRKLTFGEAEERIRRFWQPYHAALAALIAETRDWFDACLLIDCHSMPGASGTGRQSTGLRAGGRPWHILRAAGDAAPGGSALRSRVPGASQRSLRGRLRHPALRAAARGGSRVADRGGPAALHGRGADRAPSRHDGTARPT